MSLPPPKKVTSHDVAKAAGVSQSAVSRAFTPEGKIAAKTRQRILSVARQLGYHPNAFARSLVQQKTNIVGVLMGSIDNQFYPKVLETLTAQLQANGRQVMLFSVGPDEDIEDTLLRALQYQIEAMVMTSVTLSSTVAKTFSEAGVPVILFNRYVDEPGTFAVVCDNASGGRMAADALIGAGCERLAFVGGTPNSSTNQDRKRGFVERLAERGVALSFALEDKSYSYGWGQRAAELLLKNKAIPDGIFCSSDTIAFGVLDALRTRLAKRVPDDVCVIGFDDVPMAAWDAYALSTIRQPSDAMVEAVLEILKNPDAAPVKRDLPVQLIQRNTTRPY